MTDFIHYLPVYLPGIGLSYAAFLITIASPGPNVLALISTSMSVGRKAGMALALGISYGSLTWALLTAFGLSALLMTYAHALTTIKIIGGIYLFWLAYNAFKSAAMIVFDGELLVICVGLQSSSSHLESSGSSTFDECYQAL